MVLESKSKRADFTFFVLLNTNTKESTADETSSAETLPRRSAGRRNLIRINQRKNGLKSYVGIWEGTFSSEGWRRACLVTTDLSCDQGERKNKKRSTSFSCETKIWSKLIFASLCAILPDRSYREYIWRLAIRAVLGLSRRSCEWWGRRGRWRGGDRGYLAPKKI